MSNGGSTQIIQAYGESHGGVSHCSRPLLDHRPPIMAPSHRRFKSTHSHLATRALIVAPTPRPNTTRSAAPLPQMSYIFPHLTVILVALPVFSPSPRLFVFAVPPIPPRRPHIPTLCVARRHHNGYDPSRVPAHSRAPSTPYALPSVANNSLRSLSQTQHIWIITLVVILFALHTLCVSDHPTPRPLRALALQPTLLSRYVPSYDCIVFIVYVEHRLLLLTVLSRACISFRCGRESTDTTSDAESYAR